MLHAIDLTWREAGLESAPMRLFRSQEHPDHWVGEDEHGVLMLWPARPRGWAKRTGYSGGKRQLEEVEPALARGTGWPFGGRGPKSRSPSGVVSKTVGVRATAEERAAWERAAGGRRLSDWIRDLLNAAAAATPVAPSPPARASRSRSKP